LREAGSLVFFPVETLTFFRAIAGGLASTTLQENITITTAGGHIAPSARCHVTGRLIVEE
tara:strand:- start:788 stop:967 length:180 start_codon:yes stop_codon:yes gene_type:complete